ncbi:hypothetical protein WJX82_011245 [Trebouxia sp. C0006]
MYPPANRQHQQSAKQLVTNAATSSAQADNLVLDSTATRRAAADSVPGPDPADATDKSVDLAQDEVSGKVTAQQTASSYLQGSPSAGSSPPPERHNRKKRAREMSPQDIHIPPAAAPAIVSGSAEVSSQDKGLSKAGALPCSPRLRSAKKLAREQVPSQASDPQQEPFESLALIQQVAFPEVVQLAEEKAIVWCRVKGFPAWPAQLLSATAAKPRLGHVPKVGKLPIIFFGTIEVTWSSSKDVCSWAEGLKNDLWSKNKSKNRQLFDLGVEQVRDFLHPKGGRKAPQHWWCKPPAMPAQQAPTAVPQRTLAPSKPSNVDVQEGQSEEMPGTSSLAAPLLVALAKLGLSSEQLSRIKGKLVVELQQRRLQHQTACCTVEELSADARQGLQDLKEALQVVSVQRHTPALAAAVQQAPISAAALPPQSAASTNVPEQVAAAHNEELKNRAPQYQHIPRNVYSRGVARPKRQPRDDIHVCSMVRARQATPEPLQHVGADPAGMTPRSTTAATSSEAGSPDAEAVSAQELGCGDDCLNRLSFIHCDAKLCPCGASCTNRPFHQLASPQVEVFLTTNRGWGVKAAEPIAKGTFIIEYAGEVVSDVECERRMQVAKQTGEPHFYMMELSPGLIIDARDKGNVARLINSSCAPNCQSQKWHDAAIGEVKVGIFALTDIPVGEELSYDYQFQHYGLAQAAGAYRCMCGAATCRGTMDTQPERLKDFGKRIEVWWEGDNVYYRGTVIGFSKKAHKHTILYDDHESEKVSLDITPHRWLDENASPHTSPRLPTPDSQGRIVPPPLPASQGKPGAKAQAAAKSKRKKQTRKRKLDQTGLAAAVKPAPTLNRVAEPARLDRPAPAVAVPLVTRTFLHSGVACHPGPVLAALSQAMTKMSPLVGLRGIKQSQGPHWARPHTRQN